MPKSNLARVPLNALQREIQRRCAELPKLIVQRDELSRRIVELEGLGATRPPAKKAKRAVARRRASKPSKGRLTLKNALAQVLKGKKGVAVAEATEAVIASGYKTHSKNLKPLVYQALNHGDRFRRVSKGVYALKK